MSQEVSQAQEVSMSLNIRVYRDPEDRLMYKADITIDGFTVTTKGYLDRAYITDYIDIELQNAWAYLGFLRKEKTEEGKKADLDILLYHLERALAHALAYRIGQDNLVTKEVICKQVENYIEYMCSVNECAGLVKEDEEACIESCKKAVCGFKD